MIAQILNPMNYGFTIYSIPSILVGMSITILGIYVLVREHGSRTGLFFFFFTVCASVWLVTIAIGYAGLQEPVAYFWLRLSQIGVIFLPAAILTLSLNITQKSNQSRWLIRTSFALSVIFCIGVAFTNLHIKGLYRYFWGYYPKYGPLAIAFLVYFFIIVIYVLRLDWIEYRQSKSDKHKKRMRGLLIAFSIGYTASVDFLAALGIPLYPFGYIIAVIFLYVAAYVIIRYRLIDITPELAASRILETMQGAVIVTDLEGNIRILNRAAQKMTCYESKDILGKSLSSLIDLPSKLKDYQHIYKENVVNREMTWYNRNGQRFDLSFSISPLTDKDNTPAGVVYLIYNLTEHKKAEEELQKFAGQLELRNKELQDFAYIASHDLQEPLRKITTFGGRLKVQAGDTLGEKERDYLERMVNASTRMQTLIDGLLSYSRVSTQELPFETVNLSEIAQEVLSDLEVRIEQVKGKVEIENLPTVQADPLQMRQLIQNLIGNALKFHKKDNAPIVKVYSRDAGYPQNSDNRGQPGKIWEIIVQDNGIGFEEKYIDRIFGVFQRLHQHSEYEGSGIGLAICLKIAQRHGGTITAKSTPGVGSTFIFTLPKNI